MSAPGITKTITLSNAWQRLGALYDSNYPDKLVEGAMVANGCFLYAATNGFEIAYADNTPSGGVSKGHAYAEGDSLIADNSLWVKRAWLRNSTADSNAVVAVTPVLAC